MAEETPTRIAREHLEHLQAQWESGERGCKEYLHDFRLAAEAAFTGMDLREACGPVFELVRLLADNSLADDPVWCARLVLKDFSFADAPSAPDWFVEAAREEG